MSTNKQIASAFRAAREIFVAAKGHAARHLCCCLDEVGTPAAEAAVLVIEQRLSGRLTLLDWLLNTHPELHPYLESFETQQAYRLRWLDSLIEEFENK